VVVARWSLWRGRGSRRSYMGSL